MTHFLVVDDHFALRQGLRITLMDLYPGASVDAVGSLAAALERLAQMPVPDLVLLDLQLPDSSGVDTLRSLTQHWEHSDVPQRPVVVLSATGEHDPSVVVQVVEECAVGYVPKSASEHVLRQAIDMALSGCVFVPDTYLKQRIRETDRERFDACWAILTKREREVADGLVHGQTYKQVARGLQGQAGVLSDHTVRVHAQRIAWKLRLQLDDPNLESLPAKALLMMVLGRYRRSERCS
jgi:two-component system nitrate/nitrite response regulator NarL